MRLLRRKTDGSFELVSCDSNDPPPYAILSQTWSDGEVTYNELVAGTAANKAGYVKICFCVEQAAKDGLEYSWVDTCCINKATNDELSSAINSMFRWYKRARKCYVYLSDVSVPGEEYAFQQSRWFTRGCTLQELLAPATVKFFLRNGKQLGTKISLEREIHEITRIPLSAIRGQPFTEFNIEERMNWSSKRKTTLKEDIIYCLLGIFRVHIPHI
ncbi:hypothetical protein COCCADRAFT_108670 [Bipolaris zeicola 26-R-13]|uniref:Heterokaryon incompatibility domain-containing protein n=1 Tax=Cochliobolus carbonum (strain 26-R-13) TaxID=930089 RepID=W6XTE8_COCC2|nr:uncharacterized protein COCCADRAFT_108670 [Bipolaris zeicola 26-R-13]EUC28625.1 hypothetical protein COCCADRAFT_108670 [Bipolaris zeicola 26-R-13]